MFTVKFHPGETCKNVSIGIVNDNVTEATETFTVKIGEVASGTITINDNDKPCDAVTITPGTGVLNITGITAPVATVHVFDSNWATVFNQTYTNAPGTVEVPVGPGTYQVKLTFYTADWTYVCEKSQNNVTVTDNCPAGTICVTNTCPATVVNLNNAYSIPNLPANANVSWHTGTPAADANRMTTDHVQNAGAGTYYAAISVTGGCYSGTVPVKVTIAPCSSANFTGAVNAVSVASETRPQTRGVMAFPNPFTRSVRVVIDSDKREKAMLMLTDVHGRILKQLPLQLVPGSNTVLLDWLEKFTKGNYFLKINLGIETKTLKLMRQQ